MNHDLPRRPLSASEYDVFEALRKLPKSYRLKSEPQLIEFTNVDGRSFTYEPDLEIERLKDGFRVFLEIKSVAAMSLSNMVRFVEIDRKIKANAKSQSLACVWGLNRSSSKLSLRPEFRQLHIVYASNESDLINAVEHEFP